MRQKALAPDKYLNGTSESEGHTDALSYSYTVVVMHCGREAATTPPQAPPQAPLSSACVTACVAACLSHCVLSNGWPVCLVCFSSRSCSSCVFSSSSWSGAVTRSIVTVKTIDSVKRLSFPQYALTTGVSLPALTEMTVPLMANVFPLLSFIVLVVDNVIVQCHVHTGVLLIRYVLALSVTPI